MQKKSQKLADQIKQFVVDDTTAAPEEFVGPLVSQIKKEVALPEMDLSSPESARQSLEALSETASKIEEFKRRISMLRPLLEQRKFEIEEN